MRGEIITIRKNKDPYGWMSNMSPYPINFGGDIYKTTEALFQALRFDDKAIQEAIRLENNPMAAKGVMCNNHDKMVIKKHSEMDVINMRQCLLLKLIQHPKLLNELLNTGDNLIVEDVTSRGDKNGNLFWGAMLVNDEWVGKNTLGKLWMELRDKYKKNG